MNLNLHQHSILWDSTPLLGTYSISTSTSFGSLATSTQLLAGLLSPKKSPYSLLNAAKSSIDLRKNVDEVEAARTAWAFLNT